MEFGDADAEVVDALVWFGGVSRSDALEVNRLRNRFAHDYTLVDPSGGRRFVLGDGGHLVVRHNDRSVVSLVELSAVCEQVLRRVRGDIEEQQVVIRHRGGCVRIVERFTMSFVDGVA